MRREILLGAFSLLCLNNGWAGDNTGNNVTIHLKDGSTQSYPLSAVDTLSDNEKAHQMRLSYNKSEGTLAPASSIKASEVNLKGEEQPQSYNVLQSITFTQKANSGLSRDIHIDIKRPNITLVLPNGVDRSNLTLQFETTGSYLFLNGKEIESGAKCDLSESGVIKVVAFNGDIRTYQLNVISSGLPTVECTFKENFDGDWADASITIKDEKGKTGFTSSTAEMKGRGSHYKENLKNSYNLKLDQKSSLLGMTSGKRWVLLSNGYDKSLIRSSVAFDIASKYFGFDWTPHYKAVELIVNGAYMGSYTLVEQIRVAEGRVEKGTILSLEGDGTSDEDRFQAKKSGLTFVMRDPETGVSGTQLLRSQRIFDDMESSMTSGGNDYLKTIDISNFASWFLFNELVKNEEALTSDGYLTLSEEGVISMGPIWDMSKTMGGEYGNGYKNSILQESLWFSQLLKNDSFKKSLKQQLSQLVEQEANIVKIVQERAEAIQYSATANEMVWHNLGAESDDLESVSALYDEETEQLINWLKNRIAWMKENFNF